MCDIILINNVNNKYMIIHDLYYDIIVKINKYMILL